MTLITCIVIGVIFAASVYLILGGELKEICMGVFLLSHGANLTIIATSRSPMGKIPPILSESGVYVDPLPQALVLTAIVIGFAVQAFLLTMLVMTWRRTRTLDVDELAGSER
ncbi:MAG: sodium:proton antiporter [Phycisphaerae bacterium]